MTTKENTSILEEPLIPEVQKESFEQYFERVQKYSTVYVPKSKDVHETYMGISKRKYPKWNGWNILKKQKNKGLSIEQIHNNSLELSDVLYVFYYLKYLEVLYEI